MNTQVYVIDTSYLLELFSVPDFSNSGAVREVRRRYEQAIEGDSLLYVPLPCLFELADHIADVRKGRLRRTLASSLVEAVEAGIQGIGEWNITPAPGLEELSGLWRSFADDYAPRGVGLTDTFVIETAKRLRRKYGRNHAVHIWTKDTSLKAHEPDKEPDPFVG